MQSRAARAISRAVVAASTAGTIATACWLLNRILDGSERKCIEEYVDLNDESCEDSDYDSYQQQKFNGDKSFALLPVVSESDDESEDDAVGYTDDYFTAPYDVCMLSVSVQTQVDSLPNVPPVDTSDCRLCRAAAATGAMDTAGALQDLPVDEKVRALSFSETESSSDGSVLSFASELGDGSDEEALQQQPWTCSRTKQWLYVRL
ncbi:hypothetical protein PRNP1_006060 [Phytophthora ramorum]